MCEPDLFLKEHHWLKLAINSTKAKKGSRLIEGGMGHTQDVVKNILEQIKPLLREKEFKDVEEMDIDKITMPIDVDYIGDSDEDGQRMFVVIDSIPKECNNLQQVVYRYLQTIFYLYKAYGIVHTEVVYIAPTHQENAHTHLIVEVTQFITCINKFINQNFDEPNALFEMLSDIQWKEFILKTFSSIGCWANKINKVAVTVRLLRKVLKWLRSFSSKETTSKKAGRKTTSKKKSKMTALQNMKVNELANDILRGLLKEGKISQTDITILKDRNICKKIFGIDNPALSEKKNSNYYAKPVVFGNKEYWINKNWKEIHRLPLSDWLKERMNK